MRTLYTTRIDTPLGEMIAFADGKGVLLLEFIGRKELDREIERLEGVVIHSENEHLSSIRDELHHYFEGTLLTFKTPICIPGTPFQKKVWEELKRIPFGETRSYKALAQALNMPTGHRAVAQANGKNQFALVIPCHRVINSSGELGGYAAGIERKKWLLAHERNKK